MYGNLFTDRNLPGFVTALSRATANQLRFKGEVHSAIALSEGAVTCPQLSNFKILPGSSPLPVIALFTRGRT